MESVMTLTRPICLPLVVISAVFLATGCRVSRFDSLRLAGIEVVDPTRENIPMALSTWSPAGRLVKLSFVTSTNVRATVRTLNLHLRADAYFCGNRAHKLEMLQVLFDADGVIAENPEPSQDGSKVWLYIAEKSGPGRDIETGALSIPPYNLVTQPKNVCVQLHGRNMALEGFSSNVVTIAFDEIARALATTPH